MKIADLTTSQKHALLVLWEHPERYVRGDRHKSGHRGNVRLPHVNRRAAGSLTDLKLATMRIITGAGPFSSAYEFRVTDEGLRLAAERAEHGS